MTSFYLHNQKYLIDIFAEINKEELPLNVSPNQTWCLGCEKSCARLPLSLFCNVAKELDFKEPPISLMV